jgi:hypothetical protein
MSDRHEEFEDTKQVIRMSDRQEEFEDTKQVIRMLDRQVRVITLLDGLADIVLSTLLRPTDYDDLFGIFKPFL